LKIGSGHRLVGGLVAALLAVGGCSTGTLLNQAASRGGSQAGNQGTVRVLFLNNTPNRAFFTYGTYNNTDRTAVPTVLQAGTTAARTTLEADNFLPATDLPCDRVFSVGDVELLRLIDENLDTTTRDALDQNALVEGAGFTSAPLGDENAVLATEGFSPPVRALLGVDFSCGSVLVIRYEIDDVGPGPFRAVFSVIPPRGDDRGLAGEG